MKKFAVFNEITLDVSAMRHNIKFLERASKLGVIPVLKSNAYGHGISQIASVLDQLGTRIVAVDSYYEAIRARNAFSGRILVMGSICRDNVKHLKNKRISYVVQTTDDLHAFGKTRRRFDIHLEINTGMNRLGLKPNGIQAYLRVLKKFKNLRLEGIMTHLASADAPEDSSAEQQVKMFDEAVEKILAAGFSPDIVHVANSAGVGRAKSRFANFVRPGIAIYGIDVLSEKDKRFKNFEKLKPVLELRSTIIKVINLKKGEMVGYGGSFVAPRPMRIGILPLGYYEGVARALSNSGVVTAPNGQELPVVGRVCMNHTMVDLSSTRLIEGNKVIVINRDSKARNSVMGLQREFGLFSYETLARLSESIRRVVE